MRSVGFDDSIPYCHHMIISYDMFEKSIHCPIGDPRVKQAEKDGANMFEVEFASVHYFNDSGYLKCKNCGWTP